MPQPPKKNDEEPSVWERLSTLLLIGIFEIIFTAVLCFGSLIQAAMVTVLTKNELYGMTTLAFCVMCGLAGRQHVRLMLIRFLLPKKEEKKQ